MGENTSGALTVFKIIIASFFTLSAFPALFTESGGPAQVLIFLLGLAYLGYIVTKKISKKRED